MITLDVESYCHDCDAFEPKTRTIEMQNFDMCESHTDTIISCKDSRKCARMYEHAKREVLRNATDV